MDTSVQTPIIYLAKPVTILLALVLYFGKKISEQFYELFPGVVLLGTIRQVLHLLSQTLKPLLRQTYQSSLTSSGASKKPTIKSNTPEINITPRIAEENLAKKSEAKAAANMTASQFVKFLLINFLRLLVKKLISPFFKYIRQHKDSQQKGNSFHATNTDGLGISIGISLMIGGLLTGGLVSTPLLLAAGAVAIVLPHAWRNWQIEMEWAEEAVQKGIPDVVDVKLIKKPREQKGKIEGNIKRMLSQSLLGGQAAPVEWSRFKLQFDVVRRDFGISRVPSQVTREQMNQWLGFVKGGIKVLGRLTGIVSRFRNRRVLKEMLASEMGFARALVRAKGKDTGNEKFRKLVARDILKKVLKTQRLSTLRDSLLVAQNDIMALYEEIMREVALLRAADSSLFWELGKGEKVELPKYQQRDIDFLIQMPIFVGLSGLYERQSDEHAESKLDLAFNRFYDGTLRQAVLFDAVEELIAGEGKKTDGNLMGIDVSELFNTDETEVTREHREFMVTLLTYLAAKLAESPESIAKQIVLMSNKEGISDKDLLQKLTRIYPGSETVWNTLKTIDEKVMVRTRQDHQELHGPENKISMGGLVSLLKNQGRNVTALEVLGLKPEAHLDFSGINREKIALRIIDLVTSATVEIQEELKKTRFVTIQA